MAGMCCGVVGETETPSTVEPSGARQARRRRMDIHQLKFLAAAASDVVAPLPGSGRKRRKVESLETIGNSVDAKALTTPLECEKVVPPCHMKKLKEDGHLGSSSETETVLNRCKSSSETVGETILVEESSRFGVTTVCGRRRDMEDAVAVKPSFSSDLHFYGVYDGHGCSHVTLVSEFLLALEYVCKKILNQI